MALASDAADGMRESAETGLGNFEVTSLFQSGDLHAEIASRGISNLAEIDEVSTLQRVERYHDLQPQFVVQQRVDNGKFKGTHTVRIFDVQISHIDGTNVRE